MLVLLEILQRRILLVMGQEFLSPVIPEILIPHRVFLIVVQPPKTEEKST